MESWSKYLIQKINNMKIAVLLTCFNRRKLTISCLEHVLIARNDYNSKESDKIDLSFFVTDDKCTDGTPDAIKDYLKNESLIIIPADGNAYWAGGMRLAWTKAIENGPFDFYLLLNDDTDVWPNLFDELLNTHYFSLNKFSICGIYSGNTTQKGDISKITFGGKKEYGLFFKKHSRLVPNGTPQECDIVNANILLVPHKVVEEVGIFPKYYTHSGADYDYGKRVKKNNFKVFITANFCGSCDADNYNLYVEYMKLKKMSLRERKMYFRNPVHSINDSLKYYKQWRIWYIPLIIIQHFLHVYMPSLYYWLRR